MKCDKRLLTDSQCLEDWKEFPRILKVMRSNLNLRQKDVYTTIGIKHDMYSRIESGKRPVDLETLIKLGEFFGFNIFLLRKEKKE